MLAAIWEALLEIGSFCAELFPKLWPWLLRVFAVVQAWFAVNLVNSGVRFLISLGILSAWAVFLDIVIGGIDGQGLKILLSTNPLQGLPGGMLCLVCSIFPLSFFVHTVVAYIAWNLSFMGAAVTTIRGVKFLFGG